MSSPFAKNAFSRIARAVLFCAVFACAGAAWAAGADYRDFRWTPGISEGTWTTSSNWQWKTLGGSWSSDTSDYPSSSDRSVFITTNETDIVITLDDDITIKDLRIEASDGYSVTINLNGHTLSVSGKLYLGNIDTQSADVIFTVTGSGTLSANSIEYINTSDNSKVSIENGASLTTYSFNNSQNKSIAVTGDGTGSFTSGSVASAVTIDTTTVLYSDDSNYYIGLNANGGSMTDPTGVSLSVAQGDPVTLTTASDLGLSYDATHVFSKWNTAADGTGTDYADGATFTPTASIILYAQWEEVDTSTFYWIGADGDNWGSGDSWSYKQGGTAAGAYPNDSTHTAIFPATATVTLDDAYTIGKFILNSTATRTNAGRGIYTTAVDLSLAGSGAITTASFDTPNDKAYSLTIGSGIDFTITEELYGNMDTTGSVEFINNGTLYIPPTGANCNYGESKVTYSGTEPQPYTAGEELYTVTVNGISPRVSSYTLDGTFPGAGLAIALETASSVGSAKIVFPATIAFVNDTATTTEAYTAKLTVDSTETEADFTTSYEFFIPDGKTGDDRTHTSLTHSIFPSTLIDESDGFTITIKTPDGAFTLATITYTQGEHAWTGATSDEWDDATNWNFIPAGFDFTTGLLDEAIAIGTVASGNHYPNITTQTEVQSITVKNGATVTMGAGGELSLADFTCEDGGTFTASGGTVAFTAANATYTNENTAAPPTFYDISVASGNALFIDGDLAIDGTATNAGSVTFAGATSVLGSGALVNTGTIDCEANDITFGVAYSGAGAFTASSGTTTFTANADFSAASTFSANDGVLYLYNGDTVATIFTTQSGQQFYDVQAAGNVTLLVQGTAAARSFVVVTPATALSSDATVTISDGGATANSLTLSETDALVVHRPSASNTATLVLNCAVICSASDALAHTDEGTTLSVAAGKTISVPNANFAGDTVSIASGASLTVTDTISCAAYMENDGAFSCATATSAVFSGGYSGSGSFTASSTTTTYTANADFSSATGFDANGGTIYLYNGDPSASAIEYKTMSAQAFNVVQCAGNVTVRANGAVTAKKITVHAESGDELDGDFTVKLTGSSGTITLSGDGDNLAIDAYRASNTDGVEGTLFVDCAVTTSGKVYMHSGTTVKVSSGKTLACGWFAHGGGEISVNGTLAAGKVEIVGAVTSNGTGTIEVSGEWKIDTSEDNTGKFEAESGTVAFVDATTTSTITGESTFYDFLCEVYDKTIVFEAGSTQKVTHNFFVTGKEVGGTPHYITLQSSVGGEYWYIDAPATTDETATVSLVNVYDSWAFSDVTDESDNTKVITALSSPTLQNAIHWNNSSYVTYTWTCDGHSTSWEQAVNWAPSAVPGRNADIIIPEVSDGIYPVVPDDGLTINTLTIVKDADVTAEQSVSSARITLNSGSLKIANGENTAEPLVNYGIIIYTGAGRITDASETPINDSAHGGTVAYTGGNQDITDYGATDYATLIISGSGTKSIADDLSCTNFFFNGGTLSASGVQIAALGDFAVWGAGYNATDKFYSTSNTRWAYPTESDLPLSLPASPSASFDSTSGVSLTVGANFYVNGANFDGDKFSAIALPVYAASPTKEIEFNGEATAAETQWGVPYAVVCNATLSNYADVVSGGYVAAAQNVSGDDESAVEETHIQFARPKITSVRALYDDVVEVTFDMPLENRNGEINTILAEGFAYYGTSDETYAQGKAGIWYSADKDNGSPFAKAWGNADCSQELGTNPTVLYLRTTAIDGYFADSGKDANAHTWNTDATGFSAGATESTNSNGAHSTRVPSLTFLEGNVYAYYGHTMNRNYGTGLENGSVPAADTSATDEMNPVLVAVSTGQELHDTNVANQEPYDAHNFLEFRYSEAVHIADFDTLDTDTEGVNVQATASFGGIANSSNGFTVAGLAHSSSGGIQAGTRGTGSPHALYRTFAATYGNAAAAQTHRIRLSIAGYADGKVTVNGTAYNNWVGYINSITQPTDTGTISAIANDAIVEDIASKVDADSDNRLPLLTQSSTASLKNHRLPYLSIDTTTYKGWDTKPPVFARYTLSQSAWSASENANSIYEIIADTSGTHLEFHLLDNKPDYSLDEEYWISREGWHKSDESAISGSIPDIRGGARAFGDTSLTTGGIRYTTLYDASGAFSYVYHHQLFTSSVYAFKSEDITPSVTDSLYGGATGSPNGLYFHLSFEDGTSYDMDENTFTVYFNPQKCYITDLAGNRLVQTDSSSSVKALNSIDKTKPQFTMMLTPVGNENGKSYMIFSKRLAYDGTPIDDASCDRDALCDAMKSGFSFSASGTTPTISEVAYVASDEHYTVFLLTLDRPITFADINGGMITLNSSSLIQDTSGNYMNPASHAISDFALNVVNPVYAYAEGGFSEAEVFNVGTADDYVHFFTTGADIVLRSGIDITVQTRMISGELDEDGNDTAPNDMRAVLIPDVKSTLQADMVSSVINKQLGTSWRVWLPTQMEELAGAENTETQSSAEGSAVGDDAGLLWNYELPNEKDAPNAYGWGGGDEVQFIFQLQDENGDPILIDRNGSGTADFPLYALNLPAINANTMPFVDLWSFIVKDVQRQRGGVTILNNVINVNVREQTVIEVDMPTEGNLNVYVMTVDGNIVQRLEHGRVSEGLHYYKWNGTNKAGNPVARGMYFVRVVGSGIDETRKVLCVKQ